jgi:hypothetical protein
MATVSFWVGKIIEKQPFIVDALAKGLINNAALAESMIPELEEKLKKKVKFSAVNMAIRRLAEKLEKNYKPKIKFRKNTDISLKSNLAIYIIKNRKGISAHLKATYNKICADNGDFLTITQGLKEIMIVVNSSHEKDIEKIFDKRDIISKTDCLSGININLPSEAIETPGLYYLLTQAIFWNNINLIDIVSTFNELTLIVKDEDATETFDILRRLVKNNS